MEHFYETKTIIAISGVSNQGKTQTIKKVARVLLGNSKDQNIEFGLDENDCKMMFTYKDHKIGIESQGDPCSRLKASLNSFVVSKCDLILCACRTRGETLEYVKKTAEEKQYRLIKGSNFHLINVASIDPEQKDYELLNSLYAKQVIILIDKLIEVNFIRA